MKNYVKAIVGILSIAFGIASGLYIGGWLMFIKPILDVCNAFRADAMTIYLGVMSTLKILFAATAGSFILYIFVVIGVYLIRCGINRLERRK